MAANSNQTKELYEQLEELELKLKDIDNRFTISDLKRREAQESEYVLLKEAVSENEVAKKYLAQITSLREQYAEIEQYSQKSKQDNFIEILKESQQSLEALYDELLDDKQVDRNLKEKLLSAIITLQCDIQDLLIMHNIASQSSPGYLSPESPSDSDLEEPDDEDKAINEYSSQIDTIIDGLELETVNISIETIKEYRLQLEALAEKLMQDDRIGSSKLKGGVLKMIHSAQNHVAEIQDLCAELHAVSSPLTEQRSYSPRNRHSPNFYQSAPSTISEQQTPPSPSLRNSQ